MKGVEDDAVEDDAVEDDAVEDDAGGWERYLAGCRAAVDRRAQAGADPAGPGLGGPAPGSGGPARLQAVLGSEACDLDSMVCAFVLARLRQEAGREPDRLVLPLLAMAPGDLRLRPEARLLFREAGLDASLLPHLAEIDLAGWAKEGRLSLSLVDHNELAPQLAALAPAVEEIVDHHPDRGFYPWARVRRIERVGSTATLVAGMLLEEAPRLLDRTASLLLLGTILADTADLDPAAGRAHPGDRRMAARLRAAAGGAAAGLYRRLEEERYRPLALAAEDHLRRDLKQGQAGGRRYGIATVYRDLPSWLQEEPALAERIRRFARDRGFDLFVVMLASREPAGGAFRRELAVHSRDAALLQDAAAFLESRPLDLKVLAVPGVEPAAGRAQPGGLHAWRQGRGAASRKVLGPLLEEFLRRRQAGRR